MIELQIAALAGVGVTDIILAVSYCPQTLQGYVSKWEDQYNVKIVSSIEPKPLGTGGPLALARPLLMPENGAEAEPFFVCNSDVICDYPLEAMIQFHRDKGGMISIMGTSVEDPSRFGVIVCDEDNAVSRFVEKPQTYVGNLINGGVYIIEPSVLDMVKLKPTSMEREIFPRVAAKGEMYCYQHTGMWKDIGKPDDFLAAVQMQLDYDSQHNHLREGAILPRDTDNGEDGHDVASSAGDGTFRVIPPCLIHPEARVEPGAVIGPYATLGRQATVVKGARVRRSVIMPCTTVGGHACVTDSIVGSYCSLGGWSHVCDMSVLGEDVHVEDETVVRAAMVLPHKALKESIWEAQIVM
ncbi:hypothetical protein KIPB_004219 [Kipferlia bialata]|uniref:mannose-1-phosphate guanylyltransferase n=1 Tax=Kipferlia bialata TaxID=797122 RepID=A0A9K3CTH7_9EUKA|nr:hypothetical protein KIPB_004219 [Kipferlia bialata]|eukprot:g4219.t1